MKYFEDTDREGATMDSGKFNMAEEEDHGRPITDAAVRQAVEFAEGYLVPEFEGIGNPHAAGIVRTLLRAVQAPRLTGEQVEAVREAEIRLRNSDYGADKMAAIELRATLPEAFAVEVGNG